MPEPLASDSQPRSRLYKYTPRFMENLGLRGKLLLALLPSIVLILLITSYASYTVSEEFIDIALTRTVKVHTLAVAHEMEQYLEKCRSDLLFLAQGKMDAETLRSLFERRLKTGGTPYFELCFVPASGGKPVVLVRQGKIVRHIQTPELEKIQPSPFAELDRAGAIAPGQVILSDILDVTYPTPSETSANRFKTSNIIRFYTSTPGDESSPAGILFLSVDASHFRNILSLYNSKQSPLWAFPRSDELRFSYFINKKGWILFQSEAFEETGKELTTYHAREGLSGTLGKPGNSAAFRPNENQALYWNAVAEVQQGRSGLTKVEETQVANSAVKSFYFSYAPVNFRKNVQGPPEVYGGVVFVDRSKLPIVAGYKNLDMMLLVTAGNIILISFLIFGFGRILTKPISVLASRVNALSSLKEMDEIHLPYSGRDITTLQDSINNIIRRVKQQMVEIQAKDETILNVNKRERASLDREREILIEAELSRIPEIIGIGSAISSMKVNILKAAQVEVDVLITGETGTGKQLVAEAVHNHSNRSEKPFVSINCGALDENLLLDALFGHVKGAFSEAKEDRNGAFIEANGGTLFLDEIQSASPKVQQSLLRALASRKVKPLGSDKELTVDVRILAATNVDIPSLIENKSFREDLYYRLKVVSIATPALRENRENIPLLSVYYLKQAETLAGREDLELSKGALAQLVNYNWPGNVRELVNCITRAAVMAETNVIQPEEIRLENERYAWQGDQPSPQPATDNTKREKTTKPAPERPAPTKQVEVESGLNARQKETWAVIQKQETITRKEYQELVGGNLPTRTAIYDLQDFVKRGLLTKQGKGPSTRYEVVSRN